MLVLMSGEGARIIGLSLVVAVWSSLSRVSVGLIASLDCVVLLVVPLLTIVVVPIAVIIVEIVVSVFGSCCVVCVCH